MCLGLNVSVLLIIIRPTSSSFLQIFFTLFQKCILLQMSHKSPTITMQIQKSRSERYFNTTINVLDTTVNYTKLSKVVIFIVKSDPSVRRPFAGLCGLVHKGGTGRSREMFFIL